ncbi:MAG: inositol monophosphatase family protein, partial [Thermoleophilia bacterium]
MTEDLLEVALRAAHGAGALLRERAGTDPSGVVSKSSSTDLVSDADRDAEALVIGTIRAARPDDGVLAEEGGGGEGASGITWVVDPLDGTTNYLWGLPQWCVSIAATDADGGLVGVVHDPSRGETFRAVRGGGAWLGDR